MSHAFPSRVLSVLVGDDDGCVRACVLDVLADRHFRLYTAASGRAALSVLLSRPIDFSILDVEMPEMTGIEVIERYASGPWIADPEGLPVRAVRRAMPTIFMSGNPDRAIRRAARQVGTTFLDKPFAPRDLRTAVDRILEEFLS